MKTFTRKTFYASALVCTIAAITGCESIASGGESASSAKANSAPVGSPVQVTGLLTLKGPEVGAWWALVDASGAVWRLESSSPEQWARWRQWQNQRVEVQGTANGAYLSVPRLQVTSSSLKAQ